MITGEYLRCMGLYNRWQNDLLYAACAKLDEEQRAGDHGLFFRSIQRTLDHITLVDDVILDMVRRGQLTELDVNQVRISDFAELRGYRTELDEEIQDLHHQFDTRWLSGKASSKFRFSRGLQLTQMFNHQTHHRSQITAQLHRLGVDYGPTDLPKCPYL